jgi:acyl-CoA reductase-like NAD-dependent aldehyde dehydrogenase
VQKLAPALAMGNAVVVKPSPPGTEVALLLAEAVKKAGLPDGLFNVVPGGRHTALLLAAHPLMAALTVTGSTAAGHELACAVGAKRFVAELGSNAANIICADADLADAAQRMAGIAWVADAIAKGARLVLKPERRGCILGPAIVAEAPAGARLMGEEAFGPVVVVQPVADVDAALALANSSEFGLQGACSRRASKRPSKCRASCGSARSGSTRRAGSGSTPIRSAESARSASDARASAAPWRKYRNGSSPGFASTRNDPSWQADLLRPPVRHGSAQID